MVIHWNSKNSLLIQSATCPICFKSAWVIRLT
nr:MAG TPA: Polyubiquitin-B, E3 ubiquitin-protein ligase RAD18 ligase, Ubiquitin, Nucleosome, DNA [Caudoviricetes sp.]